MIEQITKDLVNLSKENKYNLNDILENLFNNDELKQKYLNNIRRSTIIGKIANDVLSKIWVKENCKIMAIWDIKLFKKHDKTWNKLVKNSLKSIDVNNLKWYDLSSSWSEKLRNSLYDYMSNYYDFSTFEKKQISDLIIPSYWWTDWFVSIIDTLRLLNKQKKVNFIYHEASFMANVQVAESFFWDESLVKIDKESKSNFFFTKEQIENLYKKQIKKSQINIFYITPIWNPTWYCLNDREFIKVIEKISELDKKAIFIFDTVYVWLLKEEKSKKMFKKIFDNLDILNQIIFTESLSKTLWMTWIRIWWIWTLNEFYLNEIKKNIILKKAGYSKILNEFTINLLSNSKKLHHFEQEIYEFWNKQRINFVDYIKQNHKKYFDFTSSSKILNREWIYVFLKLKTDFSFNEVFVNTWIIWVWMELSDWKYIRYAFGNVDYF